MAEENQVKMPKGKQITEEELTPLIAGTVGKERVLLAAVMAEDRAYPIGFGDGVESQIEADMKFHETHDPDPDTKDYKAGMEAGAAAEVAKKTEELEAEYMRGFEEGKEYQVGLADEADEMVTCPKCNGTGKMIGWGDQCKTCYGATKVKQSSLEPEEEEALANDG